MRRIAVGFLGVAAVGTALFSAPLLWSQLPGSSARPMTQRPGPEPEKRGPTARSSPEGMIFPTDSPDLCSDRRFRPSWRHSMPMATVRLPPTKSAVPRPR